MSIDVEPLPYPSRVEELSLGWTTLSFWRPPKPESLLDALVDAPLDPDDKMPYWADLWPSAIALGEQLGSMPLDGAKVLELGCGLGTVALAAAARGASVRATDWDTEALRYVEESAALNRLSIRAELLDWRDPQADLEADVLLAADVLYESRNEPWIKELLLRWKAPGRWALFSDPGRGPARALFDNLPGFRVHTEVRHIRGTQVPTGSADIYIHRIDVPA